VARAPAKRAARARAAAPATIPFRVRPMLATLVPEPFHLAGWVYEEKYDGFRILAYKEGARVTLETRNRKDRTADFPEVAAAVAKLRAPTLLLDGEVVVFDPAGISRFQLMQRRAAGAAVFMVFDCLYARGRDLRRLPLTERRAALEAEVREGPSLRLARRLAADGFEAFGQAEAEELEGLIAKDGRSLYEDDRRSMAWRKVKVRKQEEFVIGGYTRPEGARQHFGAILVGAWDDGKLRYAGKVGTGYTGRILADLSARFAPLVRPTSPFADAPRERAVTWLEPALVAQVGFTELTDEGRLRHPTYLGLRHDKAARDVAWPRAHTA
jgi:bifunctional non-homologous end joining protein LigD